MESVRLGIIGVGNMGSNHSRRLRNSDVTNCEFVSVCDVDPERLKPFEDLKTYTDSRDLIRAGDIDAVIIATPHYDHTTIGIDAFENGLHVLTEKPISVHKADARRLIDAWERSNGKIFSAMFQMRTVPVYKRIKQLIDSGELGDLIRMNWSVTAWYRTEAYYASGGWRATWKGEGGGVLLNQCPHNLDLLQWFFGMPKKVHAFCAFGKYHDIEVEDEVTAYLEFPNGSTGVFIASTGEAPGTDRLEICGDRGRLVMENGKLTFNRNTVSTAEFTKTAKSGFDKPECWNIELPIKDAKAGHAVITQNFVDAILTGCPLIAPAHEGINSVELSNAMLYSSFTGNTIDVPIDAEAYEQKLMNLIASSRFQKKTVDHVESDMSKSFR